MYPVYDMLPPTPTPQRKHVTCSPPYPPSHPNAAMRHTPARLTIACAHMDPWGTQCEPCAVYSGPKRHAPSESKSAIDHERCTLIHSLHLSMKHITHMAFLIEMTVTARTAY